MGAYELYTGDLAGSEFLRQGTDREKYYQQLRQALRDEALSGQGCPLLAHFEAQRKKDRLPMMYLLDAAAVWECYDAVFRGIRIFKFTGQGFPFKVEGRTLPWRDAARQSQAGTLPAAVMDEQLSLRLRALAARAEEPKKGGEKLPAADPRAALTLGRPAPAAGKTKDDYIRELEQERDMLRKQLAEMADQPPVQRAESQPETASHPIDVNAVIRMSEMIARNRMAEAAAEARKQNGCLAEELAKLADLQASLGEMQADMDRTQEQMAATRAEAEALRTRQRQVAEAAAAAEAECRQARAETEARQADCQAAEAGLQAAKAELNRLNGELRTLQRRQADTAAASALMRRQVEKLS